MAEQGKRRGLLPAVLGFLAVAGATTGASALLPGSSQASPETPTTTTSAPDVQTSSTWITRPAAELTTPVEPAATSSTTTTVAPRPAVTTSTTTTSTSVTTAVPAARPSAVTSFPSVLALAQAEVGGPEVRYTAEWGFSRGFWCAKFVSWLLAHAGVDVREAGPADLRWKTQRVTDPRPGDLVFIDLVADQGTGQTNHVAVVESILPDGRVATIEGNGPDEEHVARSVRAPAEITGFGRPPAATLTSVPVPPPVPDCVWFEMGKPWMCE